MISEKKCHEVHVSLWCMHGTKSLKKAHTKNYAPEFLILRALNSLVVCYIYTKIMLNMELNMMLIVLMAGVCMY